MMTIYDVEKVVVNGGGIVWWNDIVSDLFIVICILCLLLLY